MRSRPNLIRSKNSRLDWCSYGNEAERSLSVDVAKTSDSIVHTLRHKYHPHVLRNLAGGPEPKCRAEPPYSYKNLLSLHIGFLDRARTSLTEFEKDLPKQAKGFGLGQQESTAT